MSQSTNPIDRRPAIAGSMMVPSPLLRRALILDAAATGASGLLMTFGAGPLAALLGLPEALLQYAGFGLLPYAGLVAHMGTRHRLHRAAVWAVVLANALWTIECLWLPFSGWVEPTGLGHGFIIAQALVVALFATLQVLGLRRSRATAA